MNGPDHSAEAELHVRFASDCDSGTDSERVHLAYAQVHATLALVAATAPTSALPSDDGAAWDAATRPEVQR